MKEICVGVLLNVLDGYFDRAIVKSINIAARREGFNVFFVPGHRVNQRINFDRQFNAIYEIVRSPKIDAFISVTETLQSELTHQQCLDFLGHYADVPFINLNFVDPSTSAIISDDRAGIRELMQHLMVDHGYTRFAYMHGIESARGAQIRFEAFKQALSENGLGIDPNLIVTGNFVQEDARVAMHTLLDRNIPFEALVCANDGMAQGAIEVANGRGLRVPQDFAVTGFDDVFSFSHVGIPLTTIAQPFQEMANAAIALIKTQLSEGIAAVHVHTPTRLVLRGTCGCIAGAKKRIGTTADPTPTTPSERLIRSLAINGEARAKFQAFAHDLIDTITRDENSFLAKVEEIATALMNSAGTLGELQSLLLQMYSSASQEEYGKQLGAIEVGRRIMLAQILVGSIRKSTSEAERLMEGPVTYKLIDRGTAQNVMSGFDRESLFTLIEQSMRALNIPNSYIVLYPAPVAFQSLHEEFLPESSQMVFAVRNYSRQYDGLHVDFPTHDILPGKLFNTHDSHSLALFPIFHYSQHYGYLVLDISVVPHFELELVREEISSALIGGILLAEVSRARDLLKSDLTESEGHNVELVDQVVSLNHRLQALFDSALEVAIIATDPIGNIVVFNLGAEKMLGYRADEVIGKSPALFHVQSEVLHRGQELERQFGHPVEGFEIFAANPRKGESEIRNWTYIRKDGGRLQVSLVVSAVFGNSGVVNGFLGIARDITKEVAAQQNLESLNRELDERVQLRTQALQESTSRLEETMKHLQQTQKSLVQSEKLASLGSIVAGVAHELNTPLGNCVMVTSLLKEDALALHKDLQAGTLGKKRLEQYVVSTNENIELASKALARSVKLVNSFKQVAVDQGSEQRRTFQVANAIESVVSLMRVTYRYTPYTITVHVPTDLEMNSYPGALEQLISNLVNNSVLHGFENRGHGQIDITVTDEGQSLRVVYCDDGMGMPAAVVERVFDPFFTTKLGKGGSGLGMSVCYNLVTGPLGGTIELQSAPDRGATFTLVLPKTSSFHATATHIKDA